MCLTRTLQEVFREAYFLKAEGLKQIGVGKKKKGLKGKIQTPEESQWIVSGRNRNKTQQHAAEPEQGICIRMQSAFLPPPSPVHTDAQTRLSYWPHADMAEKIHCKDPLATPSCPWPVSGGSGLSPAAWAAGGDGMPRQSRDSPRQDKFRMCRDIQLNQAQHKRTTPGRAFRLEVLRKSLHSHWLFL